MNGLQSAKIADTLRQLIRPHFLRREKKEIFPIVGASKPLAAV